MWVSQGLPSGAWSRQGLRRGQQGGGSEGGALVDMGQLSESCTGAMLSLPSPPPDDLGEQPLFAWAAPRRQALQSQPRLPAQGLAHGRDPAGRRWPAAAHGCLWVQLGPGEKCPYLCRSHDSRGKNFKSNGTAQRVWGKSLCFAA